MSDRLDIDDVERFWNGQLTQAKAHPERAYLVMLIRPDEARDVLRLLARIRELEAQAEKDAGVREAVYKLGEAEAHLNDGHYSLSRATEEVDLAAKTVSDIAEQMYYAVLAAREEAE